MRAALAAAMLLLPIAAAAAPRTESEFRDLLCAGMIMERILPDGTRVDCISATHAIEIDFAPKWAEAIGQSLHYAGVTGLKPGIILICPIKVDESRCLKDAYRLEATAAAWRLPITLWACAGEARALADCRRWELGP